MNKIRLVVASLLLGAATGFAQKPFNASGTGNPIIPGYFADPTVKKFGDTYYMYATTDGSEPVSVLHRCGPARIL